MESRLPRYAAIFGFRHVAHSKRKVVNLVAVVHAWLLGSAVVPELTKRGVDVVVLTESLAVNCCTTNTSLAS